VPSGALITPRWKRAGLPLPHCSQRPFLWLARIWAIGHACRRYPTDCGAALRRRPAAKLANICAFLAPALIPKDLFPGAADDLPSGLAARTGDPLAWRQTLGHLARQSLARIDHRGLVMPSYTGHPPRPPRPDWATGSPTGDGVPGDLRGPSMTEPRALRRRARGTRGGRCRVPAREAGLGRAPTAARRQRQARRC
jgi:hypothetical protein